jgi:hypothetical protein
MIFKIFLSQDDVSSVIQPTVAELANRVGIRGREISVSG